MLIVSWIGANAHSPPGVHSLAVGHPPGSGLGPVLADGERVNPYLSPRLIVAALALPRSVLEPEAPPEAIENALLPGGAEHTTRGSSAMMGGVGRARITRAEAIALAKAECEAQDWPWREPVTVRLTVIVPSDGAGLLQYHVETSADVHGGTPWFLVSRDGRHVLAGWDGPGPWDEEDGTSADEPVSEWD